MPFKIIWSDKSYKQLDKLGSVVKNRIVKKVGKLKIRPFSKDIKKVKGTDLFRLRVGDYRVIFEIDKNKGEIMILKVGHRKNIYKK